MPHLCARRSGLGIVRSGVSSDLRDTIGEDRRLAKVPIGADPCSRRRDRSSTCHVRVMGDVELVLLAVERVAPDYGVLSYQFERCTVGRTELEYRQSVCDLFTDASGSRS